MNLIRREVSLKNKPIVLFAILAFMAVSCVAFGLGQMLSNDQNERLLDTHLKVFPVTVQSTLAQYSETLPWFSSPPGKEVPESVNSLFDSLLNLPGVFRIKVWNNEGTILWSDRSDLIGDNFAQNHNFQMAARGEVSYNNKGLQKFENQTEQDSSIVVEVYAPVKIDGKVVGVVELYENDEAVSDLMARAKRSVWQHVVFAGGLLYLLLLIAFSLTQRFSR